MPLPSELLQGISASGGGQVVLVIGAGASVEPPMNVPLARGCAEAAHRELVDDGVIEPGECTDHGDLSALADAVYAKTGGQSELVKRLPRHRFRHANPNRGCLIAAVLMREQALRGVLSLNFDLGMATALTEVGVDDDVTVISGPADHAQLSTTNLVYLHRNVDAPLEEWILRTEALEEGWKERWQEVVTAMMLGGPVTVFAGLGSPAGVLTETAKRIEAVLGGQAKVFQVDPGDPVTAPMRLALGLAEEDYLQMGWNEFMALLAERVLKRHTDQILDACRAMIASEGLADDDPAGVCSQLGELDLLGVGKVRARWMLDMRQCYRPQLQTDVDLLASLLLAIALIEKQTDTEAVFHDDGVVEFRQNGRARSSILVASGRGSRSWSAVETEIRQEPFPRERRAIEPRYGLLGGVEGARPKDIAPPPQLVVDEGSEADSILGGGELLLVSVEELRKTPELALELVA